MKKLRRLLFRLFFLFLLIWAVIFTVNTISFSSKQINVAPVEPIAIKEDAVERLASAVRIPTLSHEDHIDTTAFKQLDSFLWVNYPLVDSFLDRRKINQFSHVLKWQGQNSRLAPILLIAHMDVVGVENDGEGWAEKPFSGIIKDGYIWGRGTLDDKLSVCGILEAVEMLLSVDYMPQRTVYIAFGHDEEVGGEYGAQSIADYFQERKIEFEFILDEGSLLVENALPGCDPPVALIGLSEKGYATIDLIADVESGGHSSMPGKESAINLLSEAILKLKERPSPAKIKGPIKAMFEHIGPEMNALNKIIFANLNWTEDLIIGQMSASPASNAMLRTTMAPTIVNSGFKDNVIPKQARARVNTRILPGESVASIMEHMKMVIGDERVAVVLGENNQATEPPPISSMDAFGYGILQTTVREIYPEAIVAPSLVVATTDARHYVNVSKNIYRFLPVKVDRSEIKSIHGMNEKIKIEEYKNTIRFYRQLILNGCK